MDRRFLTVLGVSLLFALVVSSIFYQMTSRAGRRTDKGKVETSAVVAAAHALGVGVQIKPGDVKLVRVPRDRVPAGAFANIEEVVGRPVVSNILADEPVVAARLADRGSGFGLAPVIPPGMRAVAVKVNEVVGVAGFVLPGMRVDVLATVRPPGDAGARISTILQNVPVLSAGQQLQPDSSGRAVNVPVVTLLVTPEQAEILTLAGNEGRIQLVLRNSADAATDKTTGRDMTELYGRARPAPAAAPAAPRPPEPPRVSAPPPEEPPEEVVVIRGTTRSVERIGAGSGH
ncbi:MAG: Flp pilus assembly protein CpaB [Bryobacterales bacterium]|nr:Flp pilus assembly protein CpaB [Bryobacterales bacterium]